MRLRKTVTRFMFLLTVLVFCLFPASAEPAARAHKYKVNGLAVIVKSIPGTDIISAGFYLNGGVAFVPEDQAGIEQLLLSVAPKGTEEYDKETLQALTESMGTQISGWAGSDNSLLRLRCLKDKFDASWDIFQDVIVHPLLDSVEIELEREKQLTAIRSEKDSPDSYLNKISREFYFEGHPYAIPPMGTEETVSALTREDLLHYHDNQFTKSRALLVVVGDADQQDVLKKARLLSNGLPRGKRYKSNLPQSWEKEAPGMRVVKSETPIPTNYIIGRTSAPNRRSRDYHSYVLAMQVLRYRVFEEVRTKRNLSYAPSAGSRGGLTNTSFLYVTTTQPDTAIKVMFAEVDRLKNEPLTEKELHDQLMVFLTRHYLEEETVGAQMSTLATYELSGRGYREAGRFMDYLRGVTPEDVQRVARKYLSHYQFAVLGNPEAISEEVFLSY